MMAQEQSDPYLQIKAVCGRGGQGKQLTVCPLARAQRFCAALEACAQAPGSAKRVAAEHRPCGPP